MGVGIGRRGLGDRPQRERHLSRRSRPATATPARSPARCSRNCVQQVAVAGQQVELPRGPAHVVPVDDQPVDAVHDVLLVAGDLGRHARSRRGGSPPAAARTCPRCATSLRTTSVLAVQRGHLALREPARRRASAPAAIEPGAVGGHDGQLRAARASARVAAIASLTPLNHVDGVALDEHPQRPVDAAARRASIGAKTSLSMPLRTSWQRRVGAQVGQRVADPARLGDERDRQVEHERGAEAVGLVGAVEAVLQRLHEATRSAWPAARRARTSSPTRSTARRRTRSRAPRPARRRAGARGRRSPTSGPPARGRGRA